MNRHLTTLLLALAATIGECFAQNVINVISGAVYYDGYNSNVFDANLNDGILRHSNSLYARRLTQQERQAVADSASLRVTIGALCDNYDRLGAVNLAFVNKGATAYNPDSVQRIELGRFITPFMDKNRLPNRVEYNFAPPHLASLLRSTTPDSLDLWLELDIFGVPYAANKEIPGCDGRNDVFLGSLDILSHGSRSPQPRPHSATPIYIRRSFAHGGNLNNYSQPGTDTLGLTTRTFYYNLTNPVDSALICLLISNHGANRNGEEYNRRQHLVYIDGELRLKFLPGRTSCEPFRPRNTQRNGIYGREPQDPDWWQEWNNWCPGAEIPMHTIPVGPLAPGTHSITIRVPDAVFPEQQGDFPTSIYMITK